MLFPPLLLPDPSFPPLLLTVNETEHYAEPALRQTHQDLCPQTTYDNDSHFIGEETEDPGR